MICMNPPFGCFEYFMSQFSYRPITFNPHDRIVIDNAHYRSIGKDGQTHMLQLVTDDIVDNSYIAKTDRQIATLLRSHRLRCDHDYFARTTVKLKARNDTSNLYDCDEKQLRTILWKKEWCDRFNEARLDPEEPNRPTMSLNSIRDFIESRKEPMFQWYRQIYGQRPDQGRIIPGTGRRKEFAYPSPSTLRNWLLRYRQFDERAEAFKTNYHRCGNRNQLNPEVKAVVEQCVKLYPSASKPAMWDIYLKVEGRLAYINRDRPENDQLTVSYKTVRRHIHQIPPFIKDAGREGLDRAKRRYASVGRGLRIRNYLERVEIDDWEADLFVLLKETSVWEKLTPSQRKKVERERCTVTAAIDVATRCIVGLNVTPKSPSTATSKAAVRRILTDKDELRKWAGAQEEWPMHGLPRRIVTDGGPAFRGSFQESLLRLGISQQIPEKDPRKRGTIESFFRGLKKFCRQFTGQSFANVVERGDYDSEKNASLTYEIFYKLLIKYIVDVYHNTAHRGLNGRTPKQQWRKLTGGAARLPIPDEKIAACLGLHERRKIDKHGLLVNGISYFTDELDLLHGLTKGSQVDVFVDQQDLGRIFLLPPREHRTALGVSDDYPLLQVPAEEDGFNGMTLVEYASARAELREIIEAQQKADQKIRIEAFSHILESSREARKKAGLEEDALTQEQYNKLVKALKRLGRAAHKGPNYSKTPGKSLKKIGKTVGTSKNSKRSGIAKNKIAGEVPEEFQKYQNGINKYGEDK